MASAKDVLGSAGIAFGYSIKAAAERWLLEVP